MTLRVARLEERLSVEAMGSQACSVLWLIPDQAVELGDAMGKVITSAHQEGWVIVGAWERSASLSPDLATLMAREPPEAELRVGPTRLVANAVKVEGSEGGALWREFRMRVRKHEICGILTHAHNQPEAGLRFAAIDLVLAGAARQARPGASHDAVLTCMAQAFVAEALAADAVAVTRLEAEPLAPGLALTGRPGTIDRLAPGLEGAAKLEGLTFERARSRGSW